MAHFIRLDATSLVNRDAIDAVVDNGDGTATIFAGQFSRIVPKARVKLLHPDFADAPDPNVRPIGIVPPPNTNPNPQ